MSRSGYELATAYINLVPSTADLGPGIRQGLTAASASAGAAGSAAGSKFAQGFNREAEKAGSAASKVSATAVAGATAASAEAAKAAGAGATVAGTTSAGLFSAAWTSKMASSGAAWTQAGTQLSTAFTLPLAAVAVGSVGAAVSFESAFAGVEKTVDGTAAQLDRIRTGIIDMANEIPVSREEISGIAEAAGQLGIQTPNVLGFTRTMADLGVATNIVGEEGATALARLANITQMPQTEFSRLGSSVTALGNNFAATESEIVNMSLRIASAGQQVGMTETDILGIATALQSLGIESEAGGSAISRVMIKIAEAVDSGGADLDRYAQIAGMTADQFATAWQQDAAGALVAFTTGLGDASNAGESMFQIMEELSLGDIRVGNAIRSLASSGDLLTNTLQVSSTAWRENTALTAEAEKRYATTESQMRIAWNRGTDLARQFGEELAPMILAVIDAGEPLIDGLGMMVDGFSELPDPIKGTVTGLATLVALGGPTVFMLGSAASGLSSAGQMLMSVNTRLQAAPGRWSRMATAAKAAGGVLATLAISDAVFGAMNDGNGVSGRAEDAVNKIKLAVADGKNTMSGFSESVAAEMDTNRLQNLWQEFGAEIELVGHGVKGDVEQVQRAFDTLDTNEQVHVLDDLARATGDLDESGRQFAINTEFVERNRESLRLKLLAEQSQVEKNSAEWKAYADILDQIPEPKGIWDFVRTTVAEASVAEPTGPFIPPHLMLSGLTAAAQNWADATAASSEDLAEALEAVQLKSQLAAVGLQATAAASDKYRTSIEGSTSTDDLMRSSLAAGSAMRTLRIGLGLQASEAELAADSTENAAEAVDILGDALRRTDPKMATSAIRMDALGAAADGFSDAIARSTDLDDRLSSALDVGGAYREFSKTMRRLPMDIDLAGAALGRYKPRQMEAIRNIMDLGAKTTDYLSTLISSGQSHAAVRAEADRLRGSYAQQLRQLGMNEEQINRYIELLGLTPRQVETAITVSGEDEARFKIEAYSQLLQGRIPESVASSIVAAIDSGDLAGAAQQMANWAATNPVKIDVGLDEKSKERAITDVMELPRSFSFATAALGGYTEAQQRGLEAMLAAGDASKEFLATLVGTGQYDEARTQAAELRTQFMGIFSTMGLNNAEQQKYLELLGLTPGQVETAVRLSGIELNSVKLDMYSKLLSPESLPQEVRTEILAALREGDVPRAVAAYEGAIVEMESKPGPTIPVGINTVPATEGMKAWSDYVSTHPPTEAPVSADTSRANDDVSLFRWNTNLSTATVTVDANTDPAVARLGEFFRIAASPMMMILDTVAGIPTGPNRLGPQTGLPGGRDGDPTTPFAMGGLVGGVGTRDSVNAMLTPGEYVLTRDQVGDVGVDLLDRWRAGRSAAPAFSASASVPEISTSATQLSVEAHYHETQSRPTPEDLLRGTRSALYRTRGRLVEEMAGARR